MNLWRDIVDNLTDAIVVLSPQMSPQFANPAAETMLGASPVGEATVGELIRQNEWLARMVALCLASGQDLGDPESILAMAPRKLSVRAEVSPLRDEAGLTTGAIVLLHDLSHEKGAASAATTGDLNLRLSPAGLAHEVKNPLTGIKGAAELLAGMFPRDERGQQYCGVILDGVNRIASLVEQVLAVSGPQPLAQDDVNIHQVLHQALRLAGLFPQPPEGVVLIQDFDPSLPAVVGDEGALVRAFLNLIKNAAEAIGSSGTIRLHTRIETEFRMAAEGRRRQFLGVEVSDSGAGISEEQLSQLFTPFFTTKPAGTGLGLVLCQRIIALHGGRLWAQRGVVDRAKGNAASSDGMTFKAILPISLSSNS
ncbi:MAG: ATP-binding protein [Candidatus Binatus sp.]|uniref:two-component system sensor histidine kinase NtrB n=1 Tax=Candidatus Binatus sp. TaxID=2811406 RepID=UPI002728A924|nr:ATP-binding protein [Candidatus Binatus sp.]MDO8430823.1 ATP-binding protein [Candidatus Binatus sp.]